MTGKVKWFNAQKGYGFITDSQGNDVFVHHTNIIMDGFRNLDENDIVKFVFGVGNNGKKQALNVNPILTRQMIDDSLAEENLCVRTIKDAHKGTKYLVVDENDMPQTDEKGIDFLNLAAYAGFSISEE